MKLRIQDIIDPHISDVRSPNFVYPPTHLTTTTNFFIVALFTCGSLQACFWKLELQGVQEKGSNGKRFEFVKSQTFFRSNLFPSKFQDVFFLTSKVFRTPEWQTYRWKSESKDNIIILTDTSYIHRSFWIIVMMFFLWSNI